MSSISIKSRSVPYLVREHWSVVARILTRWAEHADNSRSAARGLQHSRNICRWYWSRRRWGTTCTLSQFVAASYIANFNLECVIWV